jgi:PAS domain S-box-containing protein
MTHDTMSPPVEWWSQDSSYRRLVDSVLDYGILLLDADGIVRSWNPGAERMNGYSAEEIIGQHFSLFYTDEERNAGYPTRELEEAQRTGRFEDEGWRVRKDGTRFRANVVITALRDDDGRVVGFSKVTRDLTDREAQQEIIRKAERYARSLLEASLDALVMISPEGKITDVNHVTEAITGLGRETLVGTDFSDYFTVPQLARDGYERVFSDGQVVDYPLDLRHSSGRVTPVLYNAAVYRDESGAVTGVFAAARDISEQRLAEQRIRMQSQEILELSTPVIQLWDGIVAVPLIGNLDSQRTQLFMERLLERIVETNSPMALVDIMGVPTIDTETAQHLIETITAVRLLGAQVVLTGVRPVIAQTLVHLGIDLSGITTRSSMAGGLKVALESLNLQVVERERRDHRHD